MLISHEVPLCLLEDSRSFNDYSYALVHLFDLYPKYYDFYVEELKMGRKVLLDNSIFELGAAFDSDKFAYYVEKLQPTEYIIPDSLENKEITIQNTVEFISKYGKLPGKRIGVVQGKTWEELKDCYNFMKEVVDKIAISFDYSFYLLGGKNYMQGREEFLLRLAEEGIIDEDKPHHLLGCYFPQEMKAYRGIKWIESMDTSNPIVHAIKNICYTEDGLQSKEKIKLAELIDIPIQVIDRNLLNYNVSMFRKFCNGE